MATILICLLLGVNIHATEIFTPDSIKQATIEKNAVIRVKGTVRKLEDYTKSKYYKELRFDLFNEKTELFVYVYYRYESENKTIAEKNIQNGDFVEVEGEFKSSSGKETSRFQGLLKVNQESNKTDFVAKNFKKLEKPITPVSAPIDVTKQPINVSPEKISNTDLAANLLSKCYRQLLLLSFEYAAKYFVNKLPQIPENFQKDALETKLKNDEFRLWFNDNCEHDESGRVPLELLREKSGFDDKTVKEGMKRIGLKYDKDLSKMGKNILGKTFKGGFEGCSFLKNNDE